MKKNNFKKERGFRIPKNSPYIRNKHNWLDEYYFEGDEDHDEVEDIDEIGEAKEAKAVKEAKEAKSETEAKVKKQRVMYYQ